MKINYTPHNMSDIEVKIVTRLFEMLEEEGVWVPKLVDDGGDDYVSTTTWGAALETIDSVEWSALFVTDGTHTRWVVLILGNGRDVVSDYSCSDPNFEALMERHAAWVETLLEDRTMKTFECRVYITVDAKDASEAVGKVEAALEYMLNVSNEDGDIITASVSDTDEIYDDGEE